VDQDASTMKIRIEGFELNGLLAHHYPLDGFRNLKGNAGFNRMNPQPSLLKVAAVILLIDLFWLATGGIFARAVIRDVQGEDLQPRYLSAAIVYLLLAYMLLEAKSYKQAFIYGVCIYGVYDFTNLAIFTRYDWKLAVADTLWGGVLMASAKYMLQAF
jgi:uncharacterized membrane protein